LLIQIAKLNKTGPKATMPLKKNAALWEESHPRNEAVEELKAGELEQWEKDSGYHQPSKEGRDCHVPLQAAHRVETEPAGLKRHAGSH